MLQFIEIAREYLMYEIRFEIVDDKNRFFCIH